MTQMDTVNTQFTALTDEELMVLEGGWVPYVVGGLLLVGGIAWGYYMG